MSPLPPDPATLSSENQKGPLYADRIKIHPRHIPGFYRSLKSTLMWLLLAFYHLSPWIRWDRDGDKPDQAILFDIGGKRIYLFDLEIWPQDIYMLTGIMIFAAVGLFFSAAMIGRAWCGFACFQTVWTDLFMKVESWVEGDRNARIRLDHAKPSFSKFMKRTVKHTLWLAISTFFALSFLWYFGDAASVTEELFTGQIDGWSLATFLTLLVMTYVMAGFAREQVCFYMCPYGRFQGVMFDQHSKVVTYEDWRGEDRGKPGKNRDFSDRGHCVDCSMCVQVCPTGIDIRDGQQMECIGCALCIDACNDVMAKFDLPKNLISYDSQHNIAARAANKTPEKPSHLLRPRTMIYGFILLATVIVTSFALGNRELTELNVLKDRAPFFVTLSSGKIQNAYTLRVLNKSDTTRTYLLDVEAANFPDFSIVGHTGSQFSIESGKIKTLRVLIKGRMLPNYDGKLPIQIILRDPGLHPMKVEETIFNGPK
ncbi:cytochrome c oxidase accessory protein CcoG [Terasakiella sp. A23]|uniref:cytochrome c oxidase accessory protein CcoG n=1 Tax=Terasakiella sp. FCG-A23 TaxID=3080561 RepID=UPI002955264E|nr:cytochrome c oxidase accessory protein CcoG [Terasakiella sp. A23]MDV7338176.1 cytochrome c oxidase accessory protein CcoG [Terasakiella sp. A23]